MTSLASVTFPHERLQLIARRERTHYWHAPRHRLLLDTVAKSRLAPGTRILDVGCGTGALVEALRQHGFVAEGLDPWAGESRLEQDHFKSGQAESIPWPDASFGAACAFDVLEHTDDRCALAELFRILTPGGSLFISVPAYDWLWSTRDVLAGHRRRYTRTLLRRRVEESGFEVERLFGYQFLLLPLLAISRFAARLRARQDTSSEDDPGTFLNSILRVVNSAETSMGRRWRPPFGSSLVLVARKPIAAISVPAGTAAGAGTLNSQGPHSEDNR